MSSVQHKTIDKDADTVDGVTYLKNSEFGDLPIQDFWCDSRTSRRSFEFPDRRSSAKKRFGRSLGTAVTRTGAHGKRFRKSHGLIQLLLLSSDFFILIASVVIACAVKYWMVGPEEFSPAYVGALAIQFGSVVAFFLVFNWAKCNYSKKYSVADALRQLGRAIFIAVSIQAVVAGLVGNRSILLLLLGVWAMALVLLPLGRLCVKRVLYNQGMWTKPTVVIGTGKNAKKTARALASDWLTGYYVVEFINVLGDLSGKGSSTSVENRNARFIEIEGHKIPVRTTSSLNKELFKALGNPHIVVANDSNDYWETVALLYEADVAYSSITIVPSLGGLPMIGLDMTHVFKHEVLMINVQNNLARFIPRNIKRAFDVVVASLALIILSPLLLTLATIIGLSGGNAIFGQSRVGQNGSAFKCFKFRSMVSNSQEILTELLANDPVARSEWEQDRKLKNDPRITPFGRFIRRTSLDELPQLFNVLRGDMSLVGPRPVVEDELDYYADKQNLYCLVRPGITGLWQVSGRNDVSYDERVNLDSWYSRNWSLWYDIVIIMKTLKVVLNRAGAY